MSHMPLPLKSAAPARDARQLLRLLDRIVTDMQIGDEPAGPMFDDRSPERSSKNPRAFLTAGESRDSLSGFVLHRLMIES